jgi:hypothetical protein
LFYKKRRVQNQPGFKIDPEKFFGGIMKRVLMLPVVLILLTGTLSAQETSRFALGFGIEGNVNTREGMALGGTLSFDYGLHKDLILGAKIGFSYDFNRVITLEQALYGRWNFFEFEGNALFAQADLGLSLVCEDPQYVSLFLGGVTLGLRFPLDQWYVEPYVRGGYPFMWGAGVIGGYRF